MADTGSQTANTPILKIICVLIALCGTDAAS